MTQTLYRITVQPQTPFATPLRGDTLFGQCCWLIRQSAGESALTQLLDGYTDHNPFLVLSDPFPSGYLPRPEVPAHRLGFALADPRERKTQKSQRWLPETAISEPITHWHNHLTTEKNLAKHLIGDEGQPLQRNQIQSHNSLNRLSNTTGTGESGFAPFERNQTWYHPKLPLNIYAVADARLSQTQLEQLLHELGQTGYGKEASTGAGKFTITDIARWQWRPHADANAWLTLAPCAPQGLEWQPRQCFYRTHTRFGRHGGQAAMTNKPWKNPILLADTAAVLTPRALDTGTLMTGQGLSALSHSIPGTVHQGYAPVVPIHIEQNDKEAGA
ncbi:MAG: CRISPR-associated protein Csm4 [Oceanospirillaceae bacterium]|nr:CRISPR-associated protein Csm4 [Oceanospirillaceae bacterium]